MFYPKYNKIKIDSQMETGWLVKDFFFVPFDLFQTFPDVSIFKYYGVEEYLSMFFANSKTPIISVASYWVVDKEPSILEKGFIPFSIYHNYTKIIDSFKKRNEFISGVEELSKITEYDFSMLRYFPYPINDVEYNTTMNLDLLSERRFHDTQKRLY